METRENKLEKALKVALRSLRTYGNHPIILNQAEEAINTKGIDKSKLTRIGSMNYILQVWSEGSTDTVEVDQYQPRRNRVWRGEMTREEAHTQVEETVERMKIAIKLFQDYLDGKRDYVYYWEFKND